MATIEVSCVRTVRLVNPTPGGLAFALELALMAGAASEMDIVAIIRVIKTVEIRRIDSLLWLAMFLWEPHRL